MPNLITVRHGQSYWNLENKFTGWVDIDLSPLGEEEAKKAGELLKGYQVDIIFTSALARAKRTAQIMAEVAGISAPTIENQALNERNYGDLQGLDKDETRAKFGAEQVHIWRRSYDIPPPNGESLKMTQERVMPYYHSTIASELRKGKNVMVTAHGNSLRSLIMELNKINTVDILELNIPTGEPYLYIMDTELNILDHGYLPDLQIKI